MIASIISGGLGNQMFMYAMVRSMALRNHTTMAFDIESGFTRDFLYQRSLELRNFNLELPTARLETFNYGNIGRIIRSLSRYCGHNILLPHYRMIKEDMNYFHYQKEIKELQISNAFLEGYWQAPQYFEDYKDIIRNDFQIITPMSDKIKDELKSMKQNSSPLVFIGVRRYQECKNVRPGMVLSEDYYNKAIQLIESKITNPQFVVFTQDYEWAKKNIKTQSPILYASPKNGQLSSIEDLYLMIHCNHAIISNSTFYWWGAWLQKETTNHIVIAPDNFVNKDSICKEWIKL